MYNMYSYLIWLWKSMCILRGAFIWYFELISAHESNGILQYPNFEHYFMCAADGLLRTVTEKHIDWENGQVLGLNMKTLEDR